MNKIVIRVVALCLITCILLASFSGCNEKAEAVKIEPMEIEKVDTFGFDFIGGKDVMTVSGFYGPHPPGNSIDGNREPDVVVENTFKYLSEAGVNHLSGLGWDITAPGSYEYGQRFFKYTEKYGICATIETDRTKFATVKAADEYFKPFRDRYPSFQSVFVCDEPAGPNYFENPANEVSLYAPYFEALNALGYFPYCNLFPLYDLDQTNEFIEYVQVYLDTCKPPVLSYDHYINKDSNIKAYFSNMSIIRKMAEEVNIPWWGFIAAWCPGSDVYDNPTEWGFYWNINTTLAYGAKGLQYYLGVANKEEVYGAMKDFDVLDEETMSKAATRVGILGGFGHKTRWWHYSKNITTQIKAIDHVLMNSVNKGVIRTGKEAKRDLELSEHIIEGESWRELKSISGDVMIGCFNYNGKSAFYVVNYDDEYGQHITLDFYDKYEMKVTQNAKDSYYKTNKLKLDMAPGEGVLVVIE